MMPHLDGYQTTKPADVPLLLQTIADLTDRA